MSDFNIPKECTYNQDYGFMHFGPDLSEARKCQQALEQVNPGMPFHILDAYEGSSSGCSCNFSLPKVDYYIEAGLIDGCKVGATFDSWDSNVNRYMAGECARELNVIERTIPAYMRVTCSSVNMGGLFVDNYKVICE